MNTEKVEDIYELSPGQHGILFDTLYSAEPGTYLVQSPFALSGPLNREAFKAAWRMTIDRNASLRTSFHWENLDKPYQVVMRSVEPAWQELDWRGQEASEQQLKIKEYLSADRALGIDLSRSPLIRFAVFRLDEETYEFIVTSHHLILDGWSKSSILNEVFICYDELSRGVQPKHFERQPYRDFIVWLQKQDLGEAERYWRSALRPISGSTRLPDFVDPGGVCEDGHFEEEHLALKNEEGIALTEFGRLNGCTLNTLMLGAWALLLSRYSGLKSVMFGATVAGRPSELAGFEHMVGLFINTLPTVVEIRPGEVVVDWLQRVQREQATAREYHYIPLFKVPSWAGLPPGEPVFETVLVFENYPVAGRQTYNGLGVLRSRSIERAIFPLSILVSPGQQININIIYKTSRFDRDAISRMLSHYRRILSGFVAHPLHPVDSVPMMPTSERRQLLTDWNATAREYRETCFHRLFEQQVERTPKARAVASDCEELTYEALEARANQLAHYLRELGVKPELRVGVCIERSLDMIVSVLGIWKAGGTVVPLDPGYPKERLAYMMGDSGIQRLVAQTKLKPLLLGSSCRTVCMDAERYRIVQLPTCRVDAKVEPQNLAYVIYTSGSTGVPKGVAVEHRGLCNVAEAQRQFGLVPGDQMLQFASLGFDASFFEISMALTTGATLMLLPQEKGQFGDSLLQMISNGQITAATLPPSVAATLPEEKAGALRVMTVAGEACPPSLVRRWAAGRRFWNLYGPTECTIWASAMECTAEKMPITIGRPIANTAAYVLDVNLEPVPIGVAAELYLSGVGLARGYLGRPDLTAESFIPNPVSEFAGARMYRTGDWVKLRPDGQIEFLGRVDNQIKLRGFRIELGEIEARLKQHAQIEEAIAVIRDGSAEPRITVYYQRAPGATINADEVRSWLAQQLPPYMVPAAIVLTTDWPQTANGKIDRRVLRAPEPIRRAQVELIPEPQTLVERELTEIWRQVLSIAEVGLQDNFFDLGGNSLLAIRLFGVLRPKYGERISIVDLFEFPNIRALAKHLSSRTDGLSSNTGQERASYRRASVAERRP